METSNGTEEYVEEELIFDKAGVRILLIFLYSFVFILCFFGNLTVVLVVSLHRRMRTVTKFCLGNLAFANLCVGIFCIYQNLSLFLMDSWIFGLVLCKMYYFINGLSQTASVLIFVVVAVERYLVIIHPFKCRAKLTFQKLRLVILAVWVTSALISSPRLYFVITIEHPLPMKEGEGQVVCVFSSSPFVSHAGDLLQFILLFLLPLLIVTILYTKLGIFLLHRHNKDPLLKISSVSWSKSHPEIRTHLPRSDKSRGKNPDLSPQLLSDQVPKTNGRAGPYRSNKNNMRTLPLFRNPNSHRTPEKQTRVKGAQNSRRISFHNLRRYKEMRVIVRKKSLGWEVWWTTSLRRLNVNSRAKNNNHNLGGNARIVGVVRMLMSIVLTFAICNFPYHLRKLYQNYVAEPAYEGGLTELATPLTCLLMYANCALNPIFYAFSSKSFRTSMVEIFQCKLGGQSTVVVGGKRCTWRGDTRAFGTRGCRI